WIPTGKCSRPSPLSFTTYERTGSACATVKDSREQGLLFPRRLRRGVRQGELAWGQLVESRALPVPHNPRYAPASFHPPTPSCPSKNGHASGRHLPPEEWQTLLPNAHPRYIPSR